MDKQLQFNSGVFILANTCKNLFWLVVVFVCLFVFFPAFGNMLICGVCPSVLLLALKQLKFRSGFH